MRTIRRSWMRLLVDIRQQQALEVRTTSPGGKRREARTAILEGCR